MEKKAKQKPHFMLSGFPQEQKKDLAKQIKHLGGKYTDTEHFTESCTHIVCKKPSRSEKNLAGLATGKWLLHSNYIKDSIRAKRWLNEERYEWNVQHRSLAPSEVHDYLLAPKKWREYREESQKGPFFGWIAAVMVDHVLKKSVYKRLLRLGGAKVGELEPPFQKVERVREVAKHVTHIFVDDKNVNHVQTLIKHGVLCLDPVYIGEYLLREPIPNPHEYLKIQKSSSQETFAQQPSTQFPAKPVPPQIQRLQAQNQHIPKAKIQEQVLQKQVCSTPKYPGPTPVDRLQQSSILSGSQNQTSSVSESHVQDIQTDMQSNIDTATPKKSPRLSQARRSLSLQKTKPDQTISSQGDAQVKCTQPASAPTVTTRQRTTETPTRLPRMGVSASAKRTAASRLEFNMPESTPSKDVWHPSSQSSDGGSNPLKRLVSSGIVTTPRRNRRTRGSKNSPSVRSQDIRKFMPSARDAGKKNDQDQVAVQPSCEKQDVSAVSDVALQKRSSSSKSQQTEKSKPLKRNMESSEDTNSENVKKSRQEEKVERAHGTPSKLSLMPSKENLPSKCVLTSETESKSKRKLPMIIQPVDSLCDDACDYAIRDKLLDIPEKKAPSVSIAKSLKCDQMDEKDIEKVKSAKIDVIESVENSRTSFEKILDHVDAVRVSPREPLIEAQLDSNSKKNEQDIPRDIRFDIATDHPYCLPQTLPQAAELLVEDSKPDACVSKDKDKEISKGQSSNAQTGLSVHQKRQSARQSQTTYSHKFIIAKKINSTDTQLTIPAHSETDEMSKEQNEDAIDCSNQLKVSELISRYELNRLESSVAGPSSKDKTKENAVTNDQRVPVVVLERLSQVEIIEASQAKLPAKKTRKSSSRTPIKSHLTSPGKSLLSSPDSSLNSVDGRSPSHALNQKNERKVTVRNVSRKLGAFSHLRKTIDENKNDSPIDGEVAGTSNDPFKTSTPREEEKSTEILSYSQQSEDAFPLSQLSQQSESMFDSQQSKSLSVKDAIKRIRKSQLKSHSLSWAPVSYRTLPLPPQMSVMKKKMKNSSEMSQAYTNLFHTCFDEEKFTQALDILRSSLSSMRYPRGKTMRLLLTDIILKDESPEVVHKAACLLHSVVRLHPPHKPELQQMYLTALRADGKDPDSGSEWDFVVQIIRGCLHGADKHKKTSHHNHTLALEFIVAVLEFDFHIYMSSVNDYLRHKQRDKKPKPCLLARLIWTTGALSIGCMNKRCEQLFSLVSDAVQMGAASLKVLKLLQSLVGIVAESCRHSDGVYTNVIGTPLPQRAMVFAKEFAYRVAGDLDSTGEVELVLKTTCLPWLCVTTCETLLDMFDDRLAQPLYQDLNMTPSLSKIVLRYFYLLPPLSLEDLTAYLTPHKKPRAGTPLQTYPNGSPLKLLAGSNKLSLDDPATKKMIANVNKRNRNGETPLHLACIKNNVYKLKELLMIPGIDVNAQDNFGWTPLHESCNHGHLECVKILLDYRPAKTIQSYFKQGVDKQQGRVDILMSSQDGTTALHDAVQNKMLDVIQILLKYGGNKLLSVRDQAGKCPLDYATDDEEIQSVLMSPRKQRLASIQRAVTESVLEDSIMSLSQSSQPGSSSSTFQPSEEVYKDLLGQGVSATFVSKDQSLKYVFLVTQLMQRYLKTFSMPQVLRLVNEDSIGQLLESQSPMRERLSVFVSEDELQGLEEDLTVLKQMRAHVRCYAIHLRRVVQGGKLDFVKVKILLLKNVCTLLEE